MDRDFFNLFLDKTEFPPAAKAQLMNAFGIIQSNYAIEFLTLAEDYKDAAFCAEKVEGRLKQFAAISAINEYTLWALLLIHTAKYTRGLYAQKGIDETIFWDTFTDLRYKAIECKDVKGVWGIFVAEWYRKFFTCDIIKLGRLEYENSHYYYDTPYSFGDIELFKSEEIAVKSVHIPGAPEPFDKAARLDSYRKAYEFFKDELKGGPLVCICHSWLLYPEYKNILPEKSNIVSFMGDFDVFASHDQERFEDGWRVFADKSNLPPKKLPESTSLQRAFKKHLINGGKVGCGYGVLIFDGENIINI